MRTGPVRRPAVLAVAGAAALVLGTGLGALAGPAATVPPAAALCLADGQPVHAARPDGAGGFVCGSGRRLSVVAAQEAVRQLDLEAALLKGRLDALTRATAVTTLTTQVPFAVGPTGGTPAATQPTVSCGTSGSALSGTWRATNATVQGFPTVDGRGWTFDVRPTTSGPSVTLFVTCMGAGTSGTGPTPGGGTAPAPGTG